MKKEKSEYQYLVVYRCRGELCRFIFGSLENRITPLLVSDIYMAIVKDMVEKEGHSELAEILSIRNLGETS